MAAFIANRVVARRDLLTVSSKRKSFPISSILAGELLSLFTKISRFRRVQFRFWMMYRRNSTANANVATRFKLMAAVTVFITANRQIRFSWIPFYSFVGSALHPFL